MPARYQGELTIQHINNAVVDKNCDIQLFGRLLEPLHQALCRIRERANEFLQNIIMETWLNEATM